MTTGTNPQAWLQAWKENLQLRRSTAQDRKNDLFRNLPEVSSLHVALPTFLYEADATVGNAYSDLPDKAKHQVGEMLANLGIGRPQFSIAAVQEPHGFSHTPVDKDPTVNQPAAS